MFRKLYLVYYTNGDNQGDCSHYWGADRDDAVKQHEADNPCVDVSDIFIEHDAIHKEDLEKSLERYFIKPVLNRTMLQYCNKGR